VRMAADKEAEARAKACRSTANEPRRKRRSPPLPRDYQEAVVRMAIDHRKKFEPLFAADPAIRDGGARLYRSLLCPRRRGRKPSDRVLTAVEFIKSLGRKPRSSDWNIIDLKCLPELATLSDLERRELRRKFHHAVRTHLRRHKSELE
jgi:hypothetical protein